MLMNQHQARRALGRGWHSAAERSLKSLLQPWAVGHRFRPQVRIGAHRADFACPRLKLVVEVAGHRSLRAQALREAAFRKEGWQVLRYSAHEVVEGPEDVCWAIAYECERRSQMMRRRAAWRRVERTGTRDHDGWRVSGQTGLLAA